MAFFFFEMQMHYLNFMEFSIPIYIMDIILLQPWPDKENRLTILIRPFDLMVRLI